MMIWRSLSPKTLAFVLERALERRGRTESAPASMAVDKDGSGRVLRSVPDDRATDRGAD